MNEAEMTDAEVDQLLARFDQTEPKLQRRIIVRFMCDAEKLKRFKEYVHARLDAAGVPADPESPHRAEGCRIGGRLDIVLAQFTATPEPSSQGTAAKECPIRTAGETATHYLAGRGGFCRSCGYSLGEHCRPATSGR